MRDPKDDMAPELLANLACLHTVTFWVWDFRSSERFDVTAFAPRELPAELRGT
ncbi:hypothetical protein HNQ04_002684 [Deinococcus radiopugnans ATCC 19172]|uniref:Uncharacterized protein n=1 Tax=Deinococcus radiopugnans ATCC 19172 TaxID=585398 RepID=A0ABR6NTQ0_9DEIO|nr:hypothetical protein [Deinococcus radiopugnans ATCC 19172]